MSSRDLRRQAASLLRLADKLQRSATSNTAASAELAAAAARQMEASKVALDMARRQLAR